MSTKTIFILSSPIIFLFFLNTKVNAQCANDHHSNNLNDSWLSCQKSSNPNTNRGNTHWLQLDLGYLYELGATKFWNFNVSNQTGNGFKEVALDYSSDGKQWTEIGTFQLPEAEGQANENGVEGLDLSGISARYVLITALSNWNNSNCAGISEVKIEVNAPQTTSMKAELPSPNNNSTNNEIAIDLYPNPTTSSLKIEVNKKVSAFIITNVAGHELMRREANQTSLQLDVSSLPSGLYMVQILTKEMQLVSKRFIKSGL